MNEGVKVRGSKTLCCNVCGKPLSEKEKAVEVCMDCYAAVSSTDHELGGDDYWMKKKALKEDDE